MSSSSDLYHGVGPLELFEAGGIPFSSPWSSLSHNSRTSFCSFGFFGVLWTLLLGGLLLLFFVSYAGFFRRQPYIAFASFPPLNLFYSAHLRRNGLHSSRKIILSLFVNSAVTLRACNSCHDSKCFKVGAFLFISQSIATWKIVSLADRPFPRSHFVHHKDRGLEPIESYRLITFVQQIGCYHKPKEP